MFILIGWAIVLGALIGGYLYVGGHLAVLWQPGEYIIIFGSALGAFIAGNSGPVLAGVAKGMGAAFGGSKYKKQLYLETLQLLYRIFSKVRKEGLMSIEADIEEPENSELFKSAPKVLKDHHAVEFICDYLRFMITGSLNVHEVDALMDIDIETHHHEVAVPAENTQKLADALPAFGIVAAVLGVIHVMEYVSEPPDILGKMIAAALVGTFLGILLSYGFVGPVASQMGLLANESTKYFQSIKASLLAFMSGYPPQVAVEFGRKTLESHVRPDFRELEEYIKGGGK